LIPAERCNRHARAKNQDLAAGLKDRGEFKRRHILLGRAWGGRGSGAADSSFLGCPEAAARIETPIVSLDKRQPSTPCALYRNCASR